MSVQNSTHSTLDQSNGLIAQLTDDIGGQELFSLQYVLMTQVNGQYKQRKRSSITQQHYLMNHVDILTLFLGLLPTKWS